MKEKVLASVLICALSTAVFGGAQAFSVSHSHLAPCHEHGRRAPMPDQNDHQCCSAGHDRGMPTEVANPRPIFASILAGALPVPPVEYARNPGQQIFLTHSGLSPSRPPLRV